MKYKLPLILALLIGLIVPVLTYAQNASLSLKSLDGNTVSVENQRGKVVIFAIGATWLPLSIQQASVVNQLADKYGKNNVSIYFVSTDTDNAKSKNYATDEKIRAFAKRTKMQSTILRDTTSESLKVFGVDQIPAFVILDKKGGVAGTIAGLDSEEDALSQVSTAVDKVL
ncbi:MAG: TlpA family protein disulfide reductase [Pyrinomonadaceae bacterium]|nr:TlpA family protein disulfide reductase [Pyrinomonadaceae bacterium]